AGAYAGFGGALAMGPTRMMAQGVYRIPTISYEAAVALTNTTPVGAFRGAGRPEAAAMLERMMDLAARELAVDPAEIRRRNFIQPDEFPYTTRMRTEYDSGDYETALDTALTAAGYDALRAEPAARRASGSRRERAATMLEANPDDIVVTDDGRVGVAGVPATALTWAELAHDEPLEAISDFAQDGATFPFGAHVAVVEVDMDTGAVELLRIVAV